MNDIQAVTGTTGLNEFREWAEEHRGHRLALDTETNGLWPWLSEGIDCDPDDPGRAEVRQPAFRCTHVAVAAVAPDGSASARVLDGSDRDLVRDALPLLADPAKPPRVWAHNAGFDTEVLRYAFGVHLPMSDSLTLVKALDPGRKSYSLKALREDTDEAKARLHRHYRKTRPLSPTDPAVAVRVLEILEERDGAGKKALKAMTPAQRWDLLAGGPDGAVGAMIEADGDEWLAGAFEELPFDDPFALTYVATDAIETARMVLEYSGEPLTGGFSADGRIKSRARRAAVTEVDAQRLWDGATARGYRVDLGRVGQLQAQLDEAKEASAARFGFDMTANSNAVREWIASHGIVIRDADGKDTLSNKHYDTARVPEESRSAWEEFLAVRDTAAMTNFLTGMREAVAGDRVYPRILGIGTHTGRSSSQNPNLQNVKPQMRPCFLADEGHILLGADFDSVEPRVMAGMSGDKNALEAVQGSDVYTELAVSVFGEQARGDKGRRKTAKTVFLAVGYGAGADRTAQQLGVSRDEAGKVLSDFRRRFPVLARWSRDLIERAEAGGHFTTGFGRPLPRTCDVDPARPRAYRQVNWTVQSTAADTLKQVTVNVARALGPEMLWVPIHDELILQVPDTPEWREKAMAGLREAMNFDFMGVPVSATPELIGPAWFKLGDQPAEYRDWAAGSVGAAA